MTIDETKSHIKALEEEVQKLTAEMEMASRPPTKVTKEPAIYANSQAELMDKENESSDHTLKILSGRNTDQIRREIMHKSRLLHALKNDLKREEEKKNFKLPDTSYKSPLGR